MCLLIIAYSDDVNVSFAAVTDSRLCFMIRKIRRNASWGRGGGGGMLNEPVSQPERLIKLPTW